MPQGSHFQSITFDPTDHNKLFPYCYHVTFECLTYLYSIVIWPQQVARADNWRGWEIGKVLKCRRMSDGNGCFCCCASAEDHNCIQNTSLDWVVDNVWLMQDRWMCLPYATLKNSVLFLRIFSCLWSAYMVPFLGKCSALSCCNRSSATGFSLQQNLLWQLLQHLLLDGPVKCTMHSLNLCFSEKHMFDLELHKCSEGSSHNNF